MVRYIEMPDGKVRPAIIVEEDFDLSIIADMRTSLYKFTQEGISALTPEGYKWVDYIEDILHLLRWMEQEHPTSYKADEEAKRNALKYVEQEETEEEAQMRIEEERADSRRRIQEYEATRTNLELP